ncbi:Cerevisin [Dactylellina cionopaga]|nr:Cerevisin [Dactylellina cionopaga]
MDDNSHSTHYSGIITGKKYGIAKKAYIVAVKVLRPNSCAFIDHLEKSKSQKGFKSSIINLPFNGRKSQTLDDVINTAVNNSMHFTVAAGNNNDNACTYSPAATKGTITVGASTLSDKRGYFSNYEECVDIFAPGLNIQSTWIGSRHAVQTISGTSMASSHIAGLLAYFVSLEPEKDSDYAVGKVTPEKMKKLMTAIATGNRLSDLPPGTANLLAYNGGGISNLTKIFDDNDSQTGVAKVLPGCIEEFIEEEVKALFEKARKFEA